MRIENRRKYLALKSSLSCYKCGENHPACLDFHHRNSEEKSQEVSTMITNRTWGRILREIEKCVVICANCHRKEHYYLDYVPSVISTGCKRK